MTTATYRGVSYQTPLKRDDVKTEKSLTYRGVQYAKK